jgi:hypothetical protein
MGFQSERGKTGARALNTALGNLKAVIDKAKADPRYAKLTNKTEALSDILGDKSGLGKLEPWFYFNAYEKRDQLVSHITNQLVSAEGISGFYNPDDIKKKVEDILDGKDVPLEGEPKQASMTETRGEISGIRQAP